MSDNQILVGSILTGIIAGILIALITAYGSGYCLLWGLAVSEGFQTVFIVATFYIVLFKVCRKL